MRPRAVGMKATYAASRVAAGEPMFEPHPERLLCVGGPFDGEGISGWQHPRGTYEAFQRRAPGHVRPGRPVSRTYGIWVTDMEAQDRPSLGDVHLGHYRLDFGALVAIWVPA